MNINTKQKKYIAYLFAFASDDSYTNPCLLFIILSVKLGLYVLEIDFSLTLDDLLVSFIFFSLIFISLHKDFVKPSILTDSESSVSKPSAMISYFPSLCL